MSFEPFSTNHAPQFPGMESESFDARSPAPVKSARSRNRAAWWRQDLERTGGKPVPRTNAPSWSSFTSRPDFTNYRSKSAFEAAPRLGIDRNAYARILNALDMIERGTYRHCRDKGKQGSGRSTAS